MYINYHDDLNTAPELIPDKTKVWATVSIKVGYSDMGDFVTQGKSGSYYLALELTVEDTPWQNRKIYHYLGRKGKSFNEAGKDVFKSMGDNDLVKMICTINNITLKEYNEASAQKKQLPFMLASDYSNLIDKKVYIQVGIDPEKEYNGKIYPAKNKVAFFVIPTPKPKLVEEDDEIQDCIPF